MKHVKQIVIILLVLLQIQALRGQKDSVVVESTIENIEESDFERKKDYKYQDHKYKVEKTLIKLGVFPLNIFANHSEKHFGDFNITAAIEQKLNSSLSMILDTRFDDRGTHYYQWKYNVNLGLRYYYSMNKRIQKEEGANNFHGNYFSVKIEDLLKAQETFQYPSPNSFWSSSPMLVLSWGIQRRFGKYGILDMGPYVKFGKNSFKTGIEFLIGLGW